MKVQNLLILFFTLLFFTAKAQDNLLIAVQSPRDSVVIFDLQNSRIVAQLKVGFLPHEISFDLNTAKCFVSNFGLQDYDIRIGKPGNSIAIINASSFSYVRTIYTTIDTANGNAPHGVKVRPGARKELFTNVEVGGDSMLVYDLSSFTLKNRFALPKSSHNFIFSTDGNKLWVMAANEGVFELNPANGAIIHHQKFSSAIRGLTLGEKWIVASGNNEVFLLSKVNTKLVKHFSNLGVGQLLYSAVTPDQKYILCPAVEENVVLVIEVKTGKVIRRLNTAKAPINVQIAKNFAYVSHDEDNYVTTINLKDFTTTQILSAYGTNGLIIIPKQPGN